MQVNRQVVNSLDLPIKLRFGLINKLTVCSLFMIDEHSVECALDSASDH